MKILQGAEATVEKVGNTVLKTRKQKRYRHPDIDMKLRKARTRREAKILSKLEGLAPKLIKADDKNMTISMEFLSGQLVKDALTQENAQDIGEKIGKAIKALHEKQIIHGDLTTSNMIFQDGEIKLIDFGLAIFSEKHEHKAVDLHLVKHALQAKHPNIMIWDAILTGYNPSKQLLERLTAVEKRGRYKRKPTKEI